MSHAAVQREIEADCAVLLIRAFMNKTVVAFGEDGAGKHGRHDIPKTFNIEDVDLDVWLDADGKPSGMVALFLDGYDANEVGHIFTDQNFLISVRKLLIEEHIDPECVQYASLSDQDENFVTLTFDVPLLLDWA